MITGVAKAIRQFNGQLKSAPIDVHGVLTIIWLDPNQKLLELDGIKSIDHEYVQKEGTIVLKGTRRLPKNREGPFYITTKLKNVYSLNLVLDTYFEKFQDTEY